MALTGLHVACGYAAGRGNGGVVLPLIGPAIWSETMAAAATTSGQAPSGDAVLGSPVMSVRASVDAFVATGPNPNATTGPRRFVAANTDQHLFVNPGDKLAWIAA